MTVIDRPPATPIADRGADRRERGAPRPTSALVTASVVGTVLVGIALRAWTASDLWLDEAISVDIAALPLGEVPDALRHDGHPPVYYVLLHLWTDVFGTGDVPVRSLSGVVAVATLPVMWSLGRRLGGRSTAVVALLLTASSPFAIRYATEARMYALVVLLAALGHLLVLRAADEPRPWRLVPVTLVAAALVLTHYWGLWWVAAVLVLCLLDTRRTEERTARVRVAGALVVGSAAALPWLPVAAFQAAHTGTPWARSVEPFDAGFDTLLDVGGGKWLGGRLAALVLVVAIGLAITARPIDGWRVEVDLRTVPGVRREAALAALVMAFGIGAAVVSDSAFQPRYAAVAVPALLLVVAVGVGRIPHRTLRVGAVAVLVLAGIAGAVRAADTPRTQGGEVAAALDRRAGPRDVIAYCPDQLRPSVERARARPTGSSLTFPGGSPSGRIDWVDYSDRIAAASVDAFVATVLARAGDGGAVWLVFADGYRGFDDACEEIRVGLGRARGAGEEVVAVDEAAYERHLLERFAAR